MIDLISELIDRAQEEEKELRKLSLEKNPDWKKAAEYMGSIEEIARITHRVIELRYGRAGDILLRSKDLYAKILEKNGKKQSEKTIYLEDKQLICIRLLETLRATRQYESLQSLAYMYTAAGSEIVIAEWPDRQQEINVSMDSGVAMVRDIIRELN